MIMKEFYLMAVCLLTATVFFASCNKNNPTITEATFEMQLGNNETNTIRVSVIPSDENASYCVGLIMEDEYPGEDGLVSYIEKYVSEGAELWKGTYNEVYEDLFWNTDYYAFAAQIDGGVVVGVPHVEKVKTYRPYVEFAPEGMLIAPYAVSDNGQWIVGNYDDGTTPNSYIYDVRRDSLTVVQGVVFYDVTDDGTAYGEDMFCPIFWKDGKTTQIPAPEGSSESGFFGVTPDGSVAVGYSMDESFRSKAIIYENGVLSDLTGTDIYDETPYGITAKGIGSNGNIAGYLVNNSDWLEIGCSWTGASHEFDLFPKEFMVYNEELLDGGGAWEKRYGDLEIRISPNGRYYAAFMEVIESWEYMPMLQYVYDSQENVMHEITDAAYADWHPWAVTSDGLLFLSNSLTGVSDQPYVWDFNTDKVSTFAEYASANYGYAPEGVVIQGLVMAVSDDASVIVGNYTDESNFYTTIYFMPEK